MDKTVSEIIIEMKQNAIDEVLVNVKDVLAESIRELNVELRSANSQGHVNILTKEIESAEANVAVIERFEKEPFDFFTGKLGKSERELKEITIIRQFVGGLLIKLQQNVRREILSYRKRYKTLTGDRELIVCLYDIVTLHDELTKCTRLIDYFQSSEKSRYNDPIVVKVDTSLTSAQHVDDIFSSLAAFDSAAKENRVDDLIRMNARIQILKHEIFADGTTTPTIDILSSTISSNNDRSYTISFNAQFKNVWK